MLEIDLLKVSESNPRLSNLDVYICAVPRVTKTGTVDKSCFGLNFCLKGKPTTSQQKKQKKKEEKNTFLTSCFSFTFDDIFIFTQSASKASKISEYFFNSFLIVFLLFFSRSWRIAISVSSSNVNGFMSPVLLPTRISRKSPILQSNNVYMKQLYIVNANEMKGLPINGRN